MISQDTAHTLDSAPYQHIDIERTMYTTKLVMQFVKHQQIVYFCEDELEKAIL